MVFVYIIESETDGIWYTGISTDVERRLNEHNAGKSKFTSGHKPWKLIHLEAFPDFPSARLREKQLKTTPGKLKIKNQMKG